YFGKRRTVSKTSRETRPQDEWIRIEVPVIIDRATFDATQAQLRRNSELSWSRGRKKYHYWLAGGLFMCGGCGRPMRGIAYSGIRHYSCGSRMLTVDRERWCRRAHIKADVAESYVWAKIV